MRLKRQPVNFAASLYDYKLGRGCMVGVGPNEKMCRRGLCIYLKRGAWFYAALTADSYVGAVREEAIITGASGASV